MSTKLSIKQKIDILLSAGLSLESREERYIKKRYKHHFEKSERWKKIVKQVTNGKDRTAQRDLIKTENFDKIPNGNRVKTEDPWGWD